MLSKKGAITCNIYTSKLLFFLALSCQDLVDDDLDWYSLEEKLKEEKKYLTLLKVGKMKKYYLKKIT